ncbi:MAG: SDR family oxidoreductase [Gemmataceae bacterium]
MSKPGVALVTGSGKKRVGAVVADALARRGFAIAVHYRTSAREADETIASLKSHGVKVRGYQADLGDENAVRSMVKQVITDFGRIDLLVNSAAIWNSKPLEEVTAQDVREHFEVNALGTFLCSQQVGLAMVEQTEGGLIVNIGDWADARPYVGYAAYFPSKGAVSSITRCLAVELAYRNPRIRVNAILPGPVLLPPEMTAMERREAIASTLLRREGSPDNVAQAVLSFVDNDYVTGVCLPVDGGRTIS